PGIGYDGRLRTYTAEVRLTPIKSLQAHFVYTKLKSDSTIPIRFPQDFTVANSVNAEDGDSWDVGASYLGKGGTVEGVWGRMRNSGSDPFQSDRARMRLDVDVTKNAGLVGEWSYDLYHDTPMPASNFRANRYGIYVRWRP